MVLFLPASLACQGKVDKTFCVSAPLFLLCKNQLILESALRSSSEKYSLVFK